MDVSIWWQLCVHLMVTLFELTRRDYERPLKKADAIENLQDSGWTSFADAK